MTTILKVSPMFKLGLVASACVCALSLQGAHAQTTGPSAADVQRSIEQNKPDLNRIAPKRAPKQPAAPATTDQGFARLNAVQVNSPIYQNELMAYWMSEINKPVPAQKLADFKAFAWELFQSKGYLAYITTSAQPTPEGSVLTVNVAFPTVGKVSVVTVDGNKGKEFADEVARRFSAIYKTGTPVDVQGFENQLNAAAYDLPVDLEVSMRQVDATVVDVVINLSPVDSTLGKVLGGVVQLNNYGLPQFGRNQLLGNVRVAGFTPLSEMQLTTQQSRGVGYYRADYMAPIVGTGLRWHTYATEVRSNAINADVRGLSNEVGAGLSKLLSTDRDGRWLAGVAGSARKTQNWNSGAETADRADHQVRFKLRAESSKGWVDNFNNELTFFTGRMNLDRNAADQAADADPSVGGNRVAGAYQKIEMNGGLSHVLDKDRTLTGAIRWRAQAASKNLDTYNRFSLGGTNGMRAYTSLDGVGDQGAQMSFDITHQVVPDVYGSLFYDWGIVKNSRNPLPTATDTGYYTLQGVGWEVGGKIEDVNWSLSVAHAIGKTPGAGVWNSTNTAIGDWRVNLAITKPF
jgi:hemolysin activation/secretion protein